MSLQSVISIIGLVSVLSANGTGISASDHSSTIEKNIGNFTYVEVGSGCQVTIRRGDKYTITVKTNDSLVPFLHIEQPGRTLKIYLDPSRTYTAHRLSAEITMPLLAGIRADGKSVVSLDKWRMDDDLDIVLTDGSSLTGEIICEDIDIELSGGSTASLKGKCEDLTLRAEGGSDAYLQLLATEDLAVRLTQKSRAEVNVSGTMAGALGDGSELRYTGTPANRALITGDGSVVSRIKKDDSAPAEKKDL